MKPDPVDIAFLYESFCEFTRNLQETWENNPDLAAAGNHPQQLVDAMSQLAGILRKIEEADEPLQGAPRDIPTLGEFGVQLLSDLSEIAAGLDMDESARGLENLCLPMAVWTARHGGEIRHLTPVVNALAYFAEHGGDPEFMAELLILSNEVYEAVSPRVSEDPDRSNPMRPWRLLILNRARIATRTLQPALMQPAFDNLVEHLPEDASGFFEDAMEQLHSSDYPEAVRDLMTRYYRAFGSRRVLH
jgi:hypothetical protein